MALEDTAMDMGMMTMTKKMKKLKVHLAMGGNQVVDARTATIMMQ